MSAHNYSWGKGFFKETQLLCSTIYDDPSNPTTRELHRQCQVCNLDRLATDIANPVQGFSLNEWYDSDCCYAGSSVNARLCGHLLREHDIKSADDAKAKEFFADCKKAKYKERGWAFKAEAAVLQQAKIALGPSKFPWPASAPPAVEMIVMSYAENLRAFNQAGSEFEKRKHDVLLQAGRMSGQNAPEQLTRKTLREATMKLRDEKMHKMLEQSRGMIV
jgi:hypothetical protein